MNIRFKITLLFTLLVMGILSLISYSVYYFTEQSRQEIFKSRLHTGANSRGNLFSILGENKMDVLIQLDTSSTSVITHRGYVVYENTNKPAYEFYADGEKPFPITDQMI